MALSATKGASTQYVVIEVATSDIQLKPDVSDAVGILSLVGVVALAVAVVTGIWSLMFGGSLWLGALLVFAATAALAHVTERAENERARQALGAEQAEYYSKQMNSLVGRSREILEQILPVYERKAIDALAAARSDFDRNAIYPFWEHVQDASKSLACYKEALDQLTSNGQLYTAVLAGKKHTFPAAFPIGVDLRAPESALNEYREVVQMALSGQDIARVHQFTNIWLQMKTNEILIAGFATLEQAIRSVGAEIVGAVAELQRSIDKGFAEVHRGMRDALRSFDASQRLLNESLASMDTKLYYIQYRKTPRDPFIHRA